MSDEHEFAPRLDMIETEWTMFRNAHQHSGTTGAEIPAATYRQNLRRGRVRFAEYVVEEVANGMESVDATKIQDELIAIGLYEHIKDVLPESWSKESS